MNIIQKEDHVLVLANEYKDIRFTARWDGCCHLEIFYNGDTYDAATSEKNRDYMHIYDLEQHIAQLQELLQKAKEHFGKDWPNQ